MEGYNESSTRRHYLLTLRSFVSEVKTGNTLAEPGAHMERRKNVLMKKRLIALLIIATVLERISLYGLYCIHNDESAYTGCITCQARILLLILSSMVKSSFE